MHAYSPGNRVRLGNKLVTWGFIAVLEDKGNHISSWEKGGNISGPGWERDHNMGTWNMEH
nr:hypothetical protein [Tanacetum cinerariifolium]